MQVNIEAPYIVRSDKSKVEYLGKYKVDKLLGSGTFGTVYRCTTYKGYEYAIKQINNVKMKKMMSNELDALKSVNSKYVVRYYEVFYDKQDHACIVLELCDGGTISDYMKRFTNNCIPEKTALQLFVQILVGFKEIQKAKLIHRDVKLQNILMKNGSPKIADFGLVTQTQKENQEKADGFAGTPLYMAPEILNGEHYDQQVDIWSLGILLYAMLFNDFPFFEQTPFLQYQRISDICMHSFDFERIKKQRYPNIKQATIELICRMLVINPQKRITLNELLELPIIKENDIHGDLIIKVEPIVLDHKQIVNKQKQSLKSLNSMKADSSPTVQKLKLFDFSSYISHVLPEDARENDIQSSDKLSPEYDNSISPEKRKNLIQSSTQKVQYQHEIHLLPYNQMLNRITQIVDTYELFSNGDDIIKAEFNQNEINLILYFLSRVILYNFQGLNKILDERDNIYQVENWSTFVFSKSYLSILSQVQIEMQIWMEKSTILYNHLKLINLVSFEEEDETESTENSTEMEESSQLSPKDQQKHTQEDDQIKKSFNTPKQANPSQKNQKKILKLLPDILANIISPLETEIPSDFSFHASMLPETLKISFRAVMMTAFTRLQISFKESEQQENSMFQHGPSSLSHISNSQIIAPSATASKSHTVLGPTQLKKVQNRQSLVIQTPNLPSLLLQSPNPSTNKSINSSTTNLNSLKRPSNIALTTQSQRGSLTSVNSPQSLIVQKFKDQNLNNYNSANNSPLYSNQRQQLLVQTHSSNQTIKTNANLQNSQKIQQNLTQSNSLQTPTSQKTLKQSTSSTNTNKLVFNNIKDKPQIKNESLFNPKNISKPSKFQKSHDLITESDDGEKQSNIQKLRYSFRVLLCCTINHIFLLNDQTIQLKEFQKYLLSESKNQEFTNEELLKQFICWTRQIDQEMLESQIDLIFKKYLPYIEETNLSFF